MNNNKNIQNFKAKKLEKLFQSLKENKNDEVRLKSNFYKEAKLLITLLKILGCLPIYFNKAGKYE